jgi:hypothetical protein
MLTAGSFRSLVKIDLMVVRLAAPRYRAIAPFRKSGPGPMATFSLSCDGFSPTT